MTSPRAIHRPSPRPAARITVTAVAHSGSGAAVWAPVARALPAETELRAVRLPGRESRIAEPPHPDVASAAREVAELVRADGRPTVLVGACSGALVALETAARVDGSVAVLALVALRQPSVRDTAPTGERAPGNLSGPELREWLRGRRLTPESLLDDAEAFHFYEPVIRADLRMVNGFQFQHPRLDCPVTLLRAAGDEEPDAGAWRAVTSAGPPAVPDPVAGDPLTAHPAVVAQVLERCAAAFSA